MTPSLSLQTSPLDEEESSHSRQRNSNHIRSNSSDEDLSQIVKDLDTEETNVEDSTVEGSGSVEEETSTALQQKSQRLHNFRRKLSHLEIPAPHDLDNENSTVEPSSNNASEVSVAREEFAAETGNMAPKQDSFDEEHGDCEVEKVTKEAILQRINSKRGTKSYQLGKQLSCKWTTGAGPRISCVRDYPSELQVRALEKVNLSPRRVIHSRSTSALCRRFSTPPGFAGKVAWSTGSPVHGKGVSLQGSSPYSKENQ